MPTVSQPRSVRFYLVALCCALSLPPLIVAGVMTKRFSDAETTRLIEGLAGINERMLSAVERRHAADIAALRGLATSPTIRDGNLGAFQPQARDLIATEFPGAQILLLTPRGDIAGDTDPDRSRRDPGPPAVTPDQRRQIVSNVVARDTFLTSYYRLVIPVQIDGDIRYDLIARMPLTRLEHITRSLLPDDNYFASIVDSSGAVVARSTQSDRVYGKVPPGIAQNNNADSYSGFVVNPQGIETYAYFRRRAPYRWGVGIGIAKSALYQTYDRSLTQLAAMAIGVVLTGLALAFWSGRTISNAVQQTVNAARRLETGHDATMRQQPIAEFDVVGTAIGDASRQLRRHADDLERRIEMRTRQLAEKTSLLETTLAHMDQGLIVISPDKRIQLYNSRAAELIGVPEENFARFPSIVEIIAFSRMHGQLEDIPTDLRLVLDGELRPGVTIVNERERPDGTVVEVRTVPLADGRIVRTYTDITARKRTEQRLEHIALHDPMTGLPNRMALRDHLRTTIEKCRTSGAIAAIVMIYVNGLRQANIDYGYGTVDHVIAEFSGRLSKTIAKDDFAARVEGSLFAVVMPIHDNGDGIGALLQQLLKTLGGEYVVDNSKVALSINIGIAMYPTHGTTADQLKTEASAALYRARQSGENRCVMAERDDQMAAAG